jgi:hypothetical protein
MVSLYVKWFQWIINEFTNYSEYDLVGKQWIPYFSEQGLANCTHIWHNIWKLLVRAIRKLIGLV